jgi:hypothetical protein
MLKSSCVLVFVAMAVCVMYAVMVDVVDMLVVASSRWRYGICASKLEDGGTDIMRRMRYGQLCMQSSINQPVPHPAHWLCCFVRRRMVAESSIEPAALIATKGFFYAWLCLDMYVFDDRYCGSKDT